MASSNEEICTSSLSHDQAYFFIEDILDYLMGSFYRGNPINVLYMTQKTFNFMKQEMKKRDLYDEFTKTMANCDIRITSNMEDFICDFGFIPRRLQ